jgi:hypothetical protein
VALFGVMGVGSVFHELDGRLRVAEDWIVALGQ